MALARAATAILEYYSNALDKKNEKVTSHLITSFSTLTGGADPKLTKDACDYITSELDKIEEYIQTKNSAAIIDFIFRLASYAEPAQNQTWWNISTFNETCHAIRSLLLRKLGVYELIKLRQENKPLPTEPSIALDILHAIIEEEQNIKNSNQQIKILTEKNKKLQSDPMKKQNNEALIELYKKDIFITQRRIAYLGDASYLEGNSETKTLFPPYRKIVGIDLGAWTRGLMYEYPLANQQHLIEGIPLILQNYDLLFLEKHPDLKKLIHVIENPPVTPQASSAPSSGAAGPVTSGTPNSSNSVNASQTPTSGVAAKGSSSRSNSASNTPSLVAKIAPPPPPPINPQKSGTSTVFSLLNATPTAASGIEIKFGPVPTDTQLGKEALTLDQERFLGLINEIQIVNDDLKSLDTANIPETERAKKQQQFRAKLQSLQTQLPNELTLNEFRTGQPIVVEEPPNTPSTMPSHSRSPSSSPMTY